MKGHDSFNLLQIAAIKHKRNWKIQQFHLVLIKLKKTESTRTLENFTEHIDHLQLSLVTSQPMQQILAKEKQRK